MKGSFYERYLQPFLWGSPEYMRLSGFVEALNERSEVPIFTLDTCYHEYRNGEIGEYLTVCLQGTSCSVLSMEEQGLVIDGTADDWARLIERLHCGPRMSDYDIQVALDNIIQYGDQVLEDIEPILPFVQ